MKNTWFFLLLFCSLTLFTHTGYAQGGMVPHGKQSVELKPAKDLKVGQIVQVRIKIDPLPGWHIYACKETGAYMPAAVYLDEENSRHVEIAGEYGDEGRLVTKYDKIMEGDLNYYEETMYFTLPVKITGMLPLIKGAVDYQACENTRCIFPHWEFELEAKAKE